MEVGAHAFNWKQKLHFHVNSFTTTIGFNMEHAQLQQQRLKV